MQNRHYDRSSKKLEKQTYFTDIRIRPAKERLAEGFSIFSHDKSNSNFDMEETTQSNDFESRSFLSKIRSVLSTNMAIAILTVVIASNTVLPHSEPPRTTAGTSVEPTAITKESVSHAQWSQLPTATRLSFMMTNPFQQFETVGMIPKSYFDNHLTIYGYTERVIDGDTFRVRHIPGYAMLLPTNNYESSSPEVKGRRGGIADTTLLIRLYGIDCPEISKNKNQVTQPFGNEAKEYTSNMIDHQVVKITLLRKDRYGRAVAMVETIPSNILASSKDLSIELARQGYAELYTGGGFEYNVSVFFWFWFDFQNTHFLTQLILARFCSSIFFGMYRIRKMT